MSKLKQIFFRIALAAALVSLGAVAEAQSWRSSQMSEQRLLRLISRVETNTDRFSNSIDAALDRSRLDGSMREDDINALVDVFEYETDQLRERVEDREAVASDAEAVLTRALRLQMIMQRYPFTATAQRDWARVRADLDQLARAFNVAWVWTPQANTARNIPVRQLIRRIESRADEFQNTIDDALDSSPLNGSELENQINTLAQNLEKEADQLRDRIDNRPGGGLVAADIEAVLDRAMLIETFMQTHGRQLSPRAHRDWARVKANLNELAKTYSVAWVWTRTGPATISIR